MTREEAMEILSASRPNGADDQDPLVAKALEFARADSALSTWLEAERETDLLFQKKLQSFPVPSELQGDILQSAKIRSIPFWKKPVYWTVAAAAAIALMAGLFWTNGREQTPSLVAFDQYRDQIAGIVSGFWMLKHHSSDMKDMQAWLADAKAPSQFSVPPKLDAMKPLGCRSFEVDGNKVSLLCYKLRDGKTEAHLFVVDRKMIENAPPENVPSFAQKSGWSMAFWSDATNVYILASKTDPDTLKELL